MEKLAYLTNTDDFRDVVVVDGLSIEECKKAQKALRKLADYECNEENGLLLRLPCEIGDEVYVSTKKLPAIDMDYEQDELPLYLKGKVVSFRQNNYGKYMKISVREKWLHEWMDIETGPDSAFIETKRYFIYPFSYFGKNVFRTREEAEAKLSEMMGSQGVSEG